MIAIDHLVLAEVRLKSLTMVSMETYEFVVAGCKLVLTFGVEVSYQLLLHSMFILAIPICLGECLYTGAVTV